MMLTQPVILGLLAALEVFFLAWLWFSYSRTRALENQLLLAFASVASLSLILIVGTVIWRISETLTTQTGESLSLLAASNSRRLSVELAREVSLLQRLSEEEALVTRIVQTSEAELSALTPTARQALLSERERHWQDQADLRDAVFLNAASNELLSFTQSFPAYAQVLVIDRFGGLVAAGGTPPEHYYYADAPWWKSAWQSPSNIPYIVLSQVTPGSRDTSVDIVMPILRPGTSASRGVLKSRFVIHNLDVFADVALPDVTSEVRLIDTSGQILYSSDPARVGEQLPDEMQQHVTAHATDWQVTAELIYGYAPLQPLSDAPYWEALGWTLIIQQPRSEALVAVRVLSQFAFIGGLLTLLLVMLVSSWVARQVTRPINTLTRAASALAAGDLDQAAETSGPKEITTLAEAFTDMTARLRNLIVNLEQEIAERRRAEEALKESEQMLASIIDFLPDATLVVDREGKVIAWNRAMEALTGFKAKDLLGKGDYEYAMPFYREKRPILVDLVLLPQEELEAQRYTTIRRQRDVLLGEAFVMLRGEEHYLMGKAAPLYDLKGEIAGAIEVIRDITERKRAEDERDTLITELEAKNTELERFTYTVSHDLKSPLITIRGFLGFVEQAALAGDVAQIKRDMTRISDATDKMQQLLNELLELSRIGRLMNPPEELSLGELAREAVDMVVGLLTERGVEIEIAPALVAAGGPMVYGDRARLMEVLQNLVENAVRYMGDQPEPRVEIGIRHVDGERIFFVRDNGIGIDPRYHEKVFGLFEKLDPQTEGTGVGLTIVKRIVEVHGGRAWVESEGAGKGSTFCFTLPDTRAE